MKHFFETMYGGEVNKAKELRKHISLVKVQKFKCIKRVTVTKDLNNTLVLVGTYKGREVVKRYSRINLEWFVINDVDLKIRFLKQLTEKRTLSIINSTRDAKNWIIEEQKLIKEVGKIESKILPSAVIFYIIKRYFYETTVRMLSGIEFNFGYGFSKVKIEMVPNRNKIDWKASAIARKEIVERGGTPYAVHTRNEIGKPVEHNNGEYWLVFTRVTEPLFSWVRKRCVIKNGSYYVFYPGKKAKALLKNYIDEGNPLPYPIRVRKATLNKQILNEKTSD